ncbi:MAG: hypothetical protein SGPRY_008287, partial [Prymnesium sp.]
ALRLSGVSASELSAVAVTVGPGLSMCLEVGVRKAVSLAQQHQLLLCRTHHMESHAMVAWLPSSPPPRLDLPVSPEAIDPAFKPTPAKKTSIAAPDTTRLAGEAAQSAQNPLSHHSTPTESTALSPDGAPPFPFLTLLVSGGHNLLVLSSGLGRHTILGSSLDDSIGEAFDKIARLLGLQQVPGGPALERLARDGDETRHHLPAPLTKTRDEVCSCRFVCVDLLGTFPFTLLVSKASLSTSSSIAGAEGRVMLVCRDSHSPWLIRGVRGHICRVSTHQAASLAALAGVACLLRLLLLGAQICRCSPSCLHAPT